MRILQHAIESQTAMHAAYVQENTRVRGALAEGGQRMIQGKAFMKFSGFSCIQVPPQCEWDRRFESDEIAALVCWLNAGGERWGFTSLGGTYLFRERPAPLQSDKLYALPGDWIVKLDHGEYCTYSDRAFQKLFSFEAQP